VLSNIKATKSEICKNFSIREGTTEAFIYFDNTVVTLLMLLLSLLEFAVEGFSISILEVVVLMFMG